jgi:exopolyphosphatase/guanosine-5'-triphosphate,3'-diphosphate pyrophosphatase
VGAIDIGTNSVLLLIASSGGEATVPVLERATITRLGEGVDQSRRLDAAACERTLACLASYADDLRAHAVTELDVVGTSAMRDAQGGSEFVDAAERLLGVRPRTIDGLEEAALTFEGSLSGLSLQGKVSVFDVGGGSTEIIHGDAGTPALPEARVSLDVGSVRLFERHVQSDPVVASELGRVVDDITRALTTAPRSSARGTPLVGVAGTVTTLAAIELGLVEYDAKRVHGHALSLASVCEIADRLASLDLAERRALSGLEPKRADVIVVGAEIVRQVMLWSGASTLLVSDRGVRWGLAERRLREPTSPTNAG